VAATDTTRLPSEFSGRRLLRLALRVIALLGVVILIALLMPGLGELRGYLADADWRWLALAVALEGLSCMSYVWMFRPIFCRKMTTRSAMEISWSELGMGSLVPASGATGVALGAWVLARDGMNSERIARRSVAFLLIKSSVNFVAVAVLGVVMFCGVGPHESVWLTLLPAAMSIAFIAGVASIPRFGHGAEPAQEASRLRRGWAVLRRWLVSGTSDAGAILRRAEIAVIAGAIGYWAFDNAVLWATFNAVGVNPPVTVILMGYLIGQIGGLLPIPGGIGGIDGGLLGTLVVYGTGASATAAAVLLYRVVLFWLPLLGGAIAFTSLRKAIDHPGRPDLCRDAIV
jgi:uncharacterized membrane protein YbhN (UPF0104 family)